MQLARGNAAAFAPLLFIGREVAPGEILVQRVDLACGRRVHGHADIDRFTGLEAGPAVDCARRQTRVAWPFISHLTVPAAYRGPVPHGRTSYVPGTKELSFLHPAAFRSDPDTARAAGFQEDRDNFLIRNVDWRANHDLGKAGLAPDLVREIVGMLSRRGKVHISACRRSMPGMISQATSRELEAAGLIANLPGDQWSALPDRIAELLAVPLHHPAAARDAYVARCPDWADVVISSLGRLGAAT